MSLDAYVYCDCYERGDIEIPDAFKGRVQVIDLGSLELTSSQLDEQIEFDAWRHSACPHEEGVALHHYLGNVAAITLMREDLRKVEPSPTFVLEQVIYNGVHAGDVIETKELPRLWQELSLLRAVPSERVRYLADCLSELLQVAELHGKPICF